MREFRAIFDRPWPWLVISVVAAGVAWPQTSVLVRLCSASIASCFVGARGPWSAFAGIWVIAALVALAIAWEKATGRPFRDPLARFLTCLLRAFAGLGAQKPVKWAGIFSIAVVVGLILACIGIGYLLGDALCENGDECPERSGLAVAALQTAAYGGMGVSLVASTGLLLLLLGAAGRRLAPRGGDSA